MKSILIKSFFSLLVFFSFISCRGEQAQKEIDFFAVDYGKAVTFAELAERFNSMRTDGTHINVITSVETKTYLKLRLKNNNLPDIIASDADSLYMEMANNNFLLDLSKEPFLSRLDFACLKAYIDEQSLTPGGIYSIPYVINFSGLLYNKDLLESWNLKPPIKWSEFLFDLWFLQRQGITPIEYTCFDAWTCLSPWNNLASDLIAPTFVSQKIDGKVSFLSTHKEIIEKYLTLYSYSQGKSSLVTNYAEGLQAFSVGKAAFMITGSWCFSYLNRLNPNLRIGLISFPSSNDVSQNSVNSGLDVALSINRKSGNLKLCREFIDFLMDKDNAQYFSDVQFCVCPIKGVVPPKVLDIELKDLIGSYKISYYADHFYPMSFNLQDILFQACVNAQNEIPYRQNAVETLNQCDIQFDDIYNE